MLDLPAGLHGNETALTRSAAPPRLGLQHGAGRPARPPALAAALASMLDQFDHGLLLVADDGHVLHANPMARAELDAEHPLQLLGRTLRSRSPRDVVPLHQALADACVRRRRGSAVLGEAEQRLRLTVVPMPDSCDSGGAGALVLLGKRKVGP
ncbi:MAG: hypothetical protein KIT60_25555 [Burkholderiaceae bacterium]|nr:hypothetical protein [Burkholderiaceae bacterium]